MVVLDLFSGQRRKGDFQDALERAASAVSLCVAVFAIDIEFDPDLGLSS